MTTRARPARTLLLGTAALFLGLAAPVIAEDKPKDHADGPAAAYEPNMNTLGQIKVEIPGFKPDTLPPARQWFAESGGVPLSGSQGRSGQRSQRGPPSLQNSRPMRTIASESSTRFVG